MSGAGRIAVDPDKLTKVGAELGKAQTAAVEVKNNASSKTTITANTWGLVGLAFQGSYEDLKGQVIEHLGLIEKFLESAEGKMKATVANYVKAEQGNAALMKKTD